MSRTRHIGVRCSQRGVRQELLETVKTFGQTLGNGEKCVLNRKGAQLVLTELDKLRKELLEILAKGGLIVVSSEERDITVYAVDSYKRQ